MGRHIGTIGGTTWRQYARAQPRFRFSLPKKSHGERSRGQPSERTPYFIRVKRYGPRSFSRKPQVREDDREIGPLRGRIKKILSENANGEGGEGHQGERDTSFVTLALDEDLFHRDVRNDGRQERFSLNERCGGGKCYLEMSGKPFAVVVERPFVQ